MLIKLNLRLPAAAAPGVTEVDGDNDPETLWDTEFSTDLIAGGGNDFIVAYQSDDDVANAAPDTLDGGAGYDTLTYSLLDDAVIVDLDANLGERIGNGGWAGSPDDLYGIEGVIGTGFADTLRGDDEANGLYGGFGNDLIEGREGHDTLSGDTGDDTVLGGYGNDMVDGWTGADLLEGGYGNDTIEGWDGDDTLRGDAGTDSMLGGDGDDLMDGGSYNDTMAGGDDKDTMDGGYGADVMSGGNGNDSMYGGVGVGADALAGDAGKDTLIGGDGDDTLDGGSQNDLLEGGDGDDELDGGDGNDTLEGGAGDDLIEGGAGIDTVVYDVAGELMINLEGVCNGDLGFDTLSGVENVTTYGSADTLWGTAAGNVMRAGGNDDMLYGVDGDDTLEGGSGHDELYGGEDDDILRGEIGDDLLEGQDGADTITGGGGEDTLVGGYGSDDLTGGSDGDIFHWDHDDLGSDNILDFAVGEDWLSFDYGFFAFEPADMDDIDALTIVLASVDGDARLIANTDDFGWSEIAEFEGVTVAELQGVIDDGEVLFGGFPEGIPGQMPDDFMPF